MNYGIFKDEQPKETVKKIKSILEKLDIEVKEEILKRQDNSNPVTSVRISIKNTPFFGTNGKGTNLENALASGYAEFMERLQGQLIFPFLGKSFCHEPDEIIKKTDIDSRQLYIAHKHLIKNSYYIGEKNPIHKLKNNETIFSPFKSLKTNETKYLPIVFIKYYAQLSNGMAAGNTYEEAMVQALSEICERYSLYHVFKNKLSLPDIPQEYYIKYDNIKNLISYIEKQDYRVIIKDASLEKGLDVVCTIFEDIKFPEKKYSVFFGSHPYLPIAIERTLTEFLQGNDISDNKTREKEKFRIIDYEDDIQTIIFNQSGKRLVYSENSKIIAQLLKPEPSYSFKPYDIKDSTNKKLAEYLCGKILNIAEDIYVKDYSLLGFPTVYIYIPSMSDILDNSSENTVKSELTFYKWLDFFHYNTKTENDNPQDLYEAVKFARLSSISSEYLSLLCSILINDKQKIDLHLNQCLNRIEQLSVKNNYNLFLNHLKNYYSNGTQYPELKSFFKKLSFKNLKKEIKVHPYNPVTDRNTKKYINKLSKKLHAIIEKNQ